uniref:F-box domain-containing protein n=1 Tax=Panagrellus redivivus TaxID=6233 RepID=A0A7E4ULF7_PANRE
MPYPLEKLAYDLRRRLRELATLNEAYALQIAAPNYYGLQPVQKVRSVLYASSYIPATSHNTPLFICPNEFAIENFIPHSKLSTIFEDVYLAPKKVFFHNSVLNMSFIQNFVNAVVNPIEKMYFLNCTFTSKNVAKVFCKASAFSALEEFTIVEPTYPSAAWWIETFVETKCVSLKAFDVNRATLSVFKISKDVFRKFVKAQRDDFQLVIYMSLHTDMLKVAKRVKKLFNEHFERRDSVDHLLNEKFVEINFGHCSWYYILRAD